jgi:hypothetical protein
VNVVTTGWYRLLGNSDMVTYGYIYKDNFNPLIPFDDVLVKDEGSCRNDEFGLRVYLEVNTKYILVVRTWQPRETGTFSICVSGLDSIAFNRSGKGLYR